ncbi:MAG: translational GTPase TypA [Planctomycetota bacterium]
MPPTATGSPKTETAIRNVAIIAHVDHGKTTLVDQLLRQSGMFRDAELDKLKGGQHGHIMDSNPLERERGITILSKNCAVSYTDEKGETFRINIVDTPGHADFGGEVERVLRLADGCLLVVDAYEGPMPQTRFVLTKALEQGLHPVVVVNKCDRHEADPERVINEVFDLLVELGADDHALDFKHVYASARDGWAAYELDRPFDELARGDLRPVFDTIVGTVPAPEMDPAGPLQMLVTSLDYSEYVGRIGIGRVFRGSIKPGQRVARIDRHGKESSVKVGKIERFEGLGRVESDEIFAGDLCSVIGLEKVDIGDTLADLEHAEALPTVHVDEPTLTMLFRINDSPFSGEDGEYLTTRQVRDRLMRELEHNVALKVEPGRTAEEFRVSGRGLLHLGILLENMRREGYELAVGKPIVITREIDGVVQEPVEELVVDVPSAQMGPVMELVGARKGELKSADGRGEGMTHLVFEITSRALIGLRARVLTATQGDAIMHHTFKRFAPRQSLDLGRDRGVMIATERGQVTGYSCENLHDRGILFIKPGAKVYAGQVVGEHNKPTDLPVNIVKEKKLDNMRSANKEATVTLKGTRDLSLEEALEYIEDDELVEITPKTFRMRKRILDEGMRKRAERAAKDRG